MPFTFKVCLPNSMAMIKVIPHGHSQNPSKLVTILAKAHIIESKNLLDTLMVQEITKVFRGVTWRPKSTSFGYNSQWGEKQEISCNQLSRYCTKRGCFEMFILCAWVFCLHVCAWCSCNAHRGQKRVADAQGLELQMVLSHYADAGNWNWPFCKSSKCS